MTIQEYYDYDDLGTRLWHEAAEYWEHVPEDSSVRKADPTAYQRYIDEHPVSTLQFIAYLAVDIFNVFCKSLKDASIVKKFFGEAVFFTGNLEIKTAKAWLGFIEIFSKADNVTKPLRERTIQVYGNNEATRLNDDGAVANGVQAEEASVWEIIAKKAAQVSDWIMPIGDVGVSLVERNVIMISEKWFRGLNGIAGIILSAQGLYEEVTRLWTGNIVRADPDDKIKSADGFVWKMRQEDEIHSWIKIAMNVSYLALGILGVASVFPGVAVAFLINPCLFTGTTANLLSYFWEKICIDPIGRKNQAAIV